MQKPRVLVVDDSAVVRRAISYIVDFDPALEMAGAVASGAMALVAIHRCNPDVVILDVEMPGMNGLEVLKRIRAANLTLPVIMFSTPTERSAADTLDALASGATDFVLKPTGVGSLPTALHHIREQLIGKITALFGHCGDESNRGVSEARENRRPSRHRRTRPSSGRPANVVAIGCSTGGPNALAALLPCFPRDFPVPVVIVQHMPAIFTETLAKRLDAASDIRVREGTAGAELIPGEAWIAPGDHHMSVSRVTGVTRLEIDQSPHVNSCRPSVDVLLNSLAEHFGKQTLAVVLTGMGTDGLEGCKSIRASGGQILTQDRKSSVVWGMAGAVTNAGISDESLALDQLSEAIYQRVSCNTESCYPRTTAKADGPGSR